MLDPSGRQEVLRTIADLRAATGVTVVLITHHMDECIDADRLLVVSDGKLVLDGAPKDVFSRVEQMRSIGLDVPATTETLYELRAAGCAARRALRRGSRRCHCPLARKLNPSVKVFRYARYPSGVSPVRIQRRDSV